MILPLNNVSASRSELFVRPKQSLTRPIGPDCTVDHNSAGQTQTPRRPSLEIGHKLAGLRVGRYDDVDVIAPNGQSMYHIPTEVHDFLYSGCHHFSLAFIQDESRLIHQAFAMRLTI
jgi:hypothetical protein